MKNLFRTNISKITKQWDNNELKDCYCLIYCNAFGLRIIWNNEDGVAKTLEGGDLIYKSYYNVLSVYETEKQAREHLSDFIKWAQDDLNNI